MIIFQSPGRNFFQKTPVTYPFFQFLPMRGSNGEMTDRVLLPSDTPDSGRNRQLSPTSCVFSAIAT